MHIQFLQIVATKKEKSKKSVIYPLHRDAWNVFCFSRFDSPVFQINTEACVAPQTQNGCLSRCKQEGSRGAKMG